MNMGLISLLVLVVAIFIGFKRNVNTGLVSIGFAFLLGFFVMVNISKDPAVAKMVAMSSADAKGTALVAGWNTSLFFMLVGMTFLFAVAKVNGTLELLARKAAYLAGGNKKLIPILFFVFATVLAAIGPGNISTCALLLPIGMAVAKEEKINSLLMAGMVIAGSNAGGLSPIAPTGIIGVQLAEKIGFQTGQHVFMNMLIAQLVMAAVMYFVLGGFKLKADVGVKKEKPAGFSGIQIQTLVVIALVVAAIIVLKLHVGMVAFFGGAILLLMGAADEKKTIASMPWSTLLLVCGVGVLVNVVDKAGGITYLTETLSAFMGQKTAAPILTIVGGLMSSVSSASGVVMPTLIPTVPGIVETMGGAVKGETLISAIILGAHFVTNSPLSTLGALAMASADESESEKLFGQLMILGFGGILFGALLVFVGIVR